MVPRLSNALPLTRGRASARRVQRLVRRCLASLNQTLPSYWTQAVVVDVDGIIYVAQPRGTHDGSACERREARDSKGGGYVSVPTVTTWVHGNRGRQRRQCYCGQDCPDPRSLNEDPRMILSNWVACNGADRITRQPARTVSLAVFVEGDSRTVQDEADSSRILRTIARGASREEQSDADDNSCQFHGTFALP